MGYGCHEPMGPYDHLLPRNTEREKEERKQVYDAGKALAEEIIESRVGEINVQPPTDESLAAAAEVGLKLGREAYTRELGGGALNSAFLFMHTEYSTRYPHDLNFATVQSAAAEAFNASKFEFVEVDFSAIDSAQPAK